MRATPFWLLFTLAVAGATATPAVLAESATAKTLPPNLQKLDEGTSADITSRPPEPTNRTTEKRSQGVVTDVEVHSGGSHYHLKQSAVPSVATPGDGMTNSVRPAQWQIKEFDWGGRDRKAVPADGLEAPAAPPALAPSKK